MVRRLDSTSRATPAAPASRTSPESRARVVALARIDPGPAPRCGETASGPAGSRAIGGAPGAVRGRDADRLRGSVEPGILPQDVQLEPLEVRTRLDPELLREPVADPAEHVERLRLAARAIQGEHQLAGEPLAIRVTGDEIAELTHELLVASCPQVEIDALLDDGQPELLESRDGPAGERLPSHVGERGAAPQPERVAEGVRGPAGLGRRDPSGRSNLRFESSEVDLVGRGAERVARRAREEDVVRLQRPTQARHLDLQHLRGGRRRVAAPESLDEAVGRDGLVEVEDEDRQERPGLAAAERDRPPTRDRLHRPEDADRETARLVSLDARLLCVLHVRPRARPGGDTAAYPERIPDRLTFVRSPTRRVGSGHRRTSDAGTTGDRPDSAARFDRPRRAHERRLRRGGPGRQRAGVRLGPCRSALGVRPGTEPGSGAESDAAARTGCSRRSPSASGVSRPPLPRRGSARSGWKRIVGRSSTGSIRTRTR